MKRRVLSFVIALALCLNLCPTWALAAEDGTSGGLCPHHPAHTDECGYAPEDSGALCTFICRICPIDGLISKLPSSVSASDSEQVQAQLSEIYALYDGLTADEQRQVDLSCCAALQEQIDDLGIAAVSDDPFNIPAGIRKDILSSDKIGTTPYVVQDSLLTDTSGHTLSCTNECAIQVVATGQLYLMGKVTSKKAAGVEVESGGFLGVMGADTVISGTYALEIASGATVKLAAGTYTGTIAAIWTEDGDFDALLMPGCVYFDASGNPVPPEELASAKTLVVKQCTDHVNKIYTANAGALTHTWTCQACKTEGSEPCTFTFDGNGKGDCGLCHNEVTVEVDRESLKELAYDTSNSGNVQPAHGTVTVKTKDGTVLTEDADYTVKYSTQADVGSTNVTVTVTVVMGTNNGTFTKGYTFTKDELEKPVLEWDAAKPITVTRPYDGEPVAAGELPSVTINITSSVDLHPYLQYSYKMPTDTAYTDGLPTNAGTYDVVVSLPERPEIAPDLEAASSEPITLIISTINLLTTAPAAARPTYNREVQDLATSGTLCAPAVRDGAQILFATEENGVYSTNIPTGINAGANYTVWYKVDVPADYAGNYNAVGPTEISGVEILRKTITPIVTLSSYKYQYDGEWKTPEVTVKDGDDMLTLPDTEYAVEYVNNRNVSTDADPAKVVVTDKPGGNYAITETEVKFQITSREQETLSITQKPDSIVYGKQFTLSTTGGSGNGDVTWKITDGENTVAKVDEKSGRVTITGHGSATVQATKSGKDPVTGVTNYNDAIATWTFTADKKAVTATVTAEDKTYNGNNIATIHAVVEQGVLSGDTITITGLTGEFDDENAGVDKTVKVDVSGAAISGNNSQHYEVSYSSLTVTATIHKATATIKHAPDAANLTYNGNAQELIDASNLLVDPTGILVEYAMSKDGPYSTNIPERTNAGTYTVWYRVQETQNYTGLAPEKVDVTIAKKPVNPVITLSGEGLENDDNATAPTPTQYYIYDGTAKEPTVTLAEADGTTIIPDTEYTVSYSNNTNVGTATVTVKAKEDGNYSFSNVSKDFRIDKEKAKVVTAPKMAGDPLTYTARAQQLVTEGTGAGGTMVYSTDNVKFEAKIPTATNAGNYTVYYKVEGDSNHSDSDVGQVTVTIAPKTVKDPTIELYDENGDPLVSYTYDGSAKKPKVVVKDGSTVIGTTDTTTGVNDEYDVVYTDNVDAGKATVSITDKLGGNYTITGSKEFVIVKADIVFNPAPSAAVITYDGKAHELVRPGVTSGGTVQYALNSPNTTFGDAIPQATEAGNYTVYYKVIGDKNHNDLNDVENQKVEVAIARKPLTAITIELTPDRFVYDGDVKLPEITVKDGKTVLPEEEYEWKCTLNGAAADAPTIQGVYTITITDAAGGNYDLSKVTANTKTFTIGKAAQAELVIDHSSAVTTNYGDTFTLTASGGSSASAVTWSVTGTAATVDASTGEVKITGVGEVTITAINPGDDNYLPVSAQWSFTAAPKPVTASVTVENKDYDGTTDATVNFASITAINGDTVTIDKTSITAVFDTASAGTGKTVTLDTSKVKVDGKDADKYAISYPSAVTAEIRKATTQITTTPAKIDPLTYSGQPQKLVTPGESNVGFIVYSLDGNTFSPEIPTGTNAGTYTVYYKVDGTADYTGVAVNTAPITVTIAPKSITPVIEPDESSYLYDGTKQEPEITVKDGKTVIDDDQYTITWANDDPAITDDILTAAGKYTADIKSKPNGNYVFTATAKVEIVPASQAALNITGQPEHVCYGDKITTLSTSGGSGNGKVTWSITDGGATSTIDPDTGELIVKDTGSITVKAERTVPNYGPVSDTWIFNVEPKPVTAVVTVTAKDYDGTTGIDNAAITAIVNPNDLVDPSDTFTISGLTGAYTNANAGKDKTVTLDASKAATTADTDKYAVSYPATAKADINRRTVTVTVTLSGNDLQTDNSGATPVYFYEYDGTDKTPTVTVKANDDGATLAASDYTFSYSNNKNVGTASVTVKCAEGGNYNFGDETVTFEIKSTAAKLTSTPQAKKLTYDGTLQDLVTVGVATGGTVVYSLSPINPDDENTYSETIPQGQNAGVYTVYYMVKGDANHEDAGSGYVSVTIDPKEITPKITLGTSSYVYSGSKCEPTVTVMDGTDVIPAGEYTVSYRDNINAGTAAAVVRDNNGGNYIVNGTAEFTITKAEPAYTAPTANTDLKYSGALQDLVKAGVTSHGTVVYSVNGGNYSAAIPAASAVGTYTIEYKVLGDANHSDTDPATLTVSIAKNTVAAPMILLSGNSFKYNGSEQRPTITVYDDDGNVIPEREYVVTITGKKGNDMVNVDTYTVKITTLDSSNYVIKDDGTGSNTKDFEIVPADQETISITGTQAKVSYGNTIQLGTTGGIGTGTVTWAVTGPSGTTIKSTITNGGLLTVKDVDTLITVTATRSMGSNYGDVSATWEFNPTKKAVTAVVTASDRNYIAGDKTATVTATVPGSELVSGDSINITGLTGTFDDANAGMNKKVTIDSTNAAVNGTNSEQYDITYPATTTASILAVAATVTADPQAVSGLTYDASKSQELVTAGKVTGGTMVYSLDGTSFTPAIPKAKDAGDYTVYYKAQGDGNHTDSAVGTIEVTIDKQTVTPKIELNPPAAPYDGQVKRPEVTVLDGDNNVIPASEYKVTYVSDGGENWMDKGDYTVKVENITGGNYVITTATKDFAISATAQNPLEIVNKPGLVYYGDTFTLSATGGSSSAAVTWSVDSTGAGVVEIDSNGFVKIIGTGKATITATRPGGANYDDATATYSLNALAKPITAIVTAEDRVYASGDKSAAIHVTWKEGALVGTDEIDVSGLTGAFDDDRVGTNKTVNISGSYTPDSTAQKYDITIPATTTASILKADAAAPSVTAVSSLTYNGSAQTLVTGGDDNTLYSDSQDGVYSATVPTGTNAGIYTVWYKAKGDDNHNDSAPQSIQVTISRKTLTVNGTNATLSGSDLKQDADGTYYYEYDGTEKKPSVIITGGGAAVPASEYSVSYSDNKNVGTAATVTIINAEGGNYDVSGTVTFEIREGTAQLTGSPQAKDLTYTGQPQELVTVGTASGGHIEYSLSESTGYGQSIPTETNAGTYMVYYKVVGDANHADSATIGSVTVTIKPKEIVDPVVTVSGTYTYDSNPQVPNAANIKVEDGGTAIPDSEYNVTFRDNTDAGIATVVITNANGGNYIVNGTGTFTIGKAELAAGDITAPTSLGNLPYNGAAQALVTPGNATGGTMVYSLDKEGEYSAAIPTGTAVDNYTVWYKVQGDGNHKDTAPQSVDASIIVNNVSNPTIQVEPAAVKYTGQKQVPTVTVKDDSGVLIDGSQYKVTYTDANGNTVMNLTDVGVYTVTITEVSGGNYIFEDTNDENTAKFEILYADQEALTITGTRERVYYGDTIQLGATGGNGTVAWKVDDGSTVAEIDSNGLLTITGVGSVTVTATSSAPGYTDQTATWRLYADKKPVTAVVTAQSKDYDGDTDATVTAALQASDLVGTDNIKITLSGEFEDASAGTDKKVKVNSTSPKFDGSTGDPENYNITYPVTTTASIRKANIETKDVTAPTAADAADLVYTGNPLALVKAGSAVGGTMEYSTDGVNYSASLPTGTNAGDYNVWYRVKGDSNHNDVDAVKLSSSVTITKQTVTKPTIEFTPGGASYDGQEHKPTVTVMDSNGRTIPAEEYTVDYGSANWRDVGDYKVKVTAKAGGNYTFDETEETFTILPAGQSPLTILGKPASVQYGDVFVLSALGGSGTGAVIWEASGANGVISIDQLSGKVEVLKSGGPVTITARKQAGGGYSETTATWTFSAEKKAVMPIVTAKNREYKLDDTSAEVVVTWQPGDLVGNDTITLNLNGAFDDANVGTGKTVRISGTVPNDDRYKITIPATTTASITPKTATVSGVAAKTDLTYNRQALALVSEGTATGGNVAYSLDGTDYTLKVPTQTNAGTYTVWYKALADDPNYQDSAASRVSVTIAPRTVANPTIELDPNTVEYDGTAKKPDVVVKDGNNIIPASEYTVSYSSNTAVGTAKVTVSNADGGNYNITQTTANFTIKAGAPAVIDEPQPRTLTYNGREQTLVTRGTAANGHMEYSFDEYDDYSTTLPKGTDAGVYEVWYKVVGDDGTETDPESVIAEILPKSVNPTVTLNLASDPLPYTGKPQKPRVTVAVGTETLSEYTDYTLTYSNNTNPGTATVAIQSVSGSNYQFYTTRTFEIAKAKAEFAIEPEAKDGLVYNGEAQELFEAGISLHGIVLYSKDTVTYTADIPTGTNVGSYTFFAKVRGDATHEDSEPIAIRAAIGRNEPKSAKVVLPKDSFSYTGSEIMPTVTVYDDSSKVIPATEYTVTYSNNTEVGKATATVTGNGKNYSFTATANFEIVGAGQTPLEITGKQDVVYYGDTLSLSTTGGNGGGAVTWTVSGPATALGNGQFKITESGMVTITATKAAEGGYTAATATWTFPAKPKPVTAIVTAANKEYDGKVDATLSIAYDGLLSGEDISNGVTAAGEFTDAMVGTGKTVTVKLTISPDISKKYEISYPFTTTASITQAAPEVTAPTVVGTLTYNGAEQALLTDNGAATGGNIMYSLDGGKTYSYTAPEAKDVGTYTVWYKVAASDPNYRDTAPAQAGTVTIAPNTGTPTASCSPNTLQYNGTAQTPAVVVLDDAGRPIPAEEYTVTVANGPAIDPGKYKATVKDNPGGNYEFSGELETEFEIVTVSQNPLSITDKPADVHYGDKFILSAIGGSGSGDIVWSIAGNGSIATVEKGVVTVSGTGSFTVEAYRAASGGYGKSNTDTVTFYADPKPITPVVTADNKPYDGNATATLTAKFKDGDLVAGDDVTLTVGGGTFETPDVGTNKKVTLISPSATGSDVGKYKITWPESTMANISRVNAQWDQEPKGAENLTYTGSAQALIANGTGTTQNGIGTVEYSTSQYGRYSTEIPTGTKADTYTVWYRVADDVNYQGIAAASITVEIKRADPGINTQPTATGTAGQKLGNIRLEGGATTAPGTFAWKDDSITPVNGGSYDVIFTPNDTANYETVTFQITVTITAASGDDTPSGGDTPGGGTSGSGTTGSDTVKTTVQNGTASTVVSAAAGSKLVQEAVENQSESIVIKPEITGSVTRNEVSIPASTVSQIKNETNAALTVSAPIADVTIPNAALDTLGSAGGTVKVATEQVDQAVVLTVTAGGKTVDSIPGGLILTVPAEDAGPGTVAVLVHEDGTRETLQKSVVEDGKISIPLSGSATVEIVDNSKAFADVQPISWEADAVAFASAHELFSGTSETTFSPDESMSRGMLATVLYRLEGCPDQEGAATYGDVSSDAWYAEGVAWAAENGIANGYGNGQFGPNDNITREQFAVMLWNYAGRPAASSHVLDFTDADQASGYALEALCWAAENGILNGYGNGQLAPGGTATRAQAAQMLKNFMENT